MRAITQLSIILFFLLLSLSSSALKNFFQSNFTYITNLIIFIIM